MSRYCPEEPARRRSQRRRTGPVSPLAIRSFSDRLILHPARRRCRLICPQQRRDHRKKTGLEIQIAAAAGGGIAPRYEKPGADDHGEKSVIGTFLRGRRGGLTIHHRLFRNWRAASRGRAAARDKKQRPFLSSSRAPASPATVTGISLLLTTFLSLLARLVRECAAKFPSYGNSLNSENGIRNV